jgi:hypothetical protein
LHSEEPEKKMSQQKTFYILPEEKSKSFTNSQMRELPLFSFHASHQ